MSLKGKTLFITGGSRGIVLAIALKAAADGANVAIAVRAEREERDSATPASIKAWRAGGTFTRHRGSCTCNYLLH